MDGTCRVNTYAGAARRRRVHLPGVGVAVKMMPRREEGIDGPTRDHGADLPHTAQYGRLAHMGHGMVAQVGVAATERSMP